VRRWEGEKVRRWEGGKWAFDELRRDKVGMRKGEKKKVRRWEGRKSDPSSSLKDGTSVYALRALPRQDAAAKDAEGGSLPLTYP